MKRNMILKQTGEKAESPESQIYISITAFSFLGIILSGK